MQEWSRKISEWWASTVDSARTAPIDQRRFLGRRLGRWLIVIPIGLGCALIGPYGTYLTMPFELRILYWLGVVFVSFTLWWGAELLTMRLLRNAWPPIRWPAVIVLFAATNSLFLTALHGWMNDALGARIPARWIDYFAGHVLFSILCIQPLIFLIERLVQQVETRASGDAIRFLTGRMPPKLRGTTPFALAAEGHYVRAYTPAGNDLITMKFEDAVASVIGVPGVQTHRSWWIALDQLVDVKPLGSAYEATLVSGLKVPVSRRRKAELSRAIEQRDALTRPAAARENGSHSAKAAQV